MERHIAIFGGSFDPPTVVHQAIIRNLLDRQEFDEVWIMPSGERMDKPQTTNVERRLAMLAIMKDEIFPDEDRLRISEFEIGLPQPTETYHTVQALEREYPGVRFWFVFGADSIDTMHEWLEGDWLRRHLPIVVVPRAGYGLPPLSQNIRQLKDIDLFEKGVSSTMVRRRVAAGGEADDLICRGVAEFISREALYGG